MLIPVVEIPIDGTVTGAELTWDGRSVATFMRAVHIWVFPLEAPDPTTPALDIEAPTVTFSDFALSPTLPLAVTRDSNSNLHSWAIDGDAPDQIGQHDVGGLLSPIRFNAAGDIFIVVQDGDAVAVRAAGEGGEAWRDGDYPKHNNQEAVFVGPDDLLVVAENPEIARLRVLGTDDDGPSGDPAPAWRALGAGNEPCGEVLGLASASEVDLLAVICSDGLVRVYDPRLWGEPERYRGALRPLDVAALSPDGRFLAALEGTQVVVWDRQTGARASVDAGERARHYPARLSLRHGLLAVDREKRLAVWRVESGGE